MREVEDHVLGLVHRRGDLLQDHVALAIHLGAVEAGGEDDVAQEIERQAEIGAQHARVIGGGVDAGRGIEIAADRLDLLGDRLRAPPVGPLEGHVLEEVGDAMLGRALAAAAGADPQPERHGLDAGARVADHGQAIGKAGQLYAHAPAPAWAGLAAAPLARAWPETKSATAR